jgi:hypothetical protein
VAVYCENGNSFPVPQNAGNFSSRSLLLGCNGSVIRKEHSEQFQVRRLDLNSFPWILLR